MWMVQFWILYECAELTGLGQEILYTTYLIIRVFMVGKEKMYMVNRLFISYTLAAMAGICFVSGIAVLSGGR